MTPALRARAETEARHLDALGFSGRAAALIRELVDEVDAAEARGRLAERADVVAHLHTGGRVACDYADAIESGEHLGAAAKP